VFPATVRTYTEMVTMKLSTKRRARRRALLAIDRLLAEAIALPAWQSWLTSETRPVYQRKGLVPNIAGAR